MVSRILKISEARVRELDMALRPRRDERGYRRYDALHIKKVAAERAERAARAADDLGRRGYVTASVAADALGVDEVELDQLPLPRIVVGQGVTVYRSDAIESLAGAIAARGK